MHTPLQLAGSAGIGLLLLLSAPSIAQKVDLDKFTYDVSYIQLPREYVAPDQRTYGVRVDASPMISDSYPPDAVYQKIGLSGYEKVERDPIVGVTIKLADLRFLKSEIETRTEQVKDRDGKVTGTNYYYRQVATYAGQGEFQIRGPKAGEKPKNPTADAAPANRFLAKATSNTDVPTITTVADNNLYRTFTYRSGEYRSAVDASRAYRDAQEVIRRNFINDFVNLSVDQVNGKLADLYGYVPVSDKQFLWILDSDNHPEYAVQQEAIKAVQTLSKTMKATESLTALSNDLQPLIEYFESLKTKYTKSDKPDRKMRYSAFFNLGRLYLLLDQPDKAIAEGKGLILNDYDTGDGKRIIEEAEELKQRLAFHHLAERHMKL